MVSCASLVTGRKVGDPWTGLGLLGNILIRLAGQFDASPETVESGDNGDAPPGSRAMS
jgi:hypothetical protein